MEKTFLVNILIYTFLTLDKTKSLKKLAFGVEALRNYGEKYLVFSSMCYSKRLRFNMLFFCGLVLMKVKTIEV